MPATLPEPQVLRCYFDDVFRPRLPARRLRWDGVADRLWELPSGLCLYGPPPTRFGLDLRSTGADTFDVRLLWDRTGLTWAGLTRAQLLGGCLNELLAAVGTDLWSLLEAPPSEEAGSDWAA